MVNHLLLASHTVLLVLEAAVAALVTWAPTALDHLEHPQVFLDQGFLQSQRLVAAVAVVDIEFRTLAGIRPKGLVVLVSRLAALCVVLAAAVDLTLAAVMT
tara:strand:+ start:1431 stop:1733 length:303 start_codon:yes stop_codon:yes gene_type:complete